MKIVKYKKGRNNKYIVLLDNDIELSLYEEVILKYELLLKKEIDNNLMHKINETNQEWEVYYSGLNSLKSRMRSTKELRELLLNKEFNIYYINNAIEKLEKQGYLNDRSYVKAYINNQMITTNKGPYIISRELSDKGIDNNIINEEIVIYSDEDQIEKINKIINKGIKTNHTRGGNILKQKIYNDLKVLGYDISIINKEISNYTFDDNSDIAKKEYDKLYRKLSRKYSGNELKNKIREKMYLKGLKYEED